MPQDVKECRQFLGCEALFLVLSQLTGLKLHRLAPQDSDDEEECGGSSAGVLLIFTVVVMDILFHIIIITIFILIAIIDFFNILWCRNVSLHITLKMMCILLFQSRTLSATWRPSGGVLAVIP